MDTQEQLRILQQILFDIVVSDDIWPPLPVDYWKWYFDQHGIIDVLYPNHIP